MIKISAMLKSKASERLDRYYFIKASGLIIDNLVNVFLIGTLASISILSYAAIFLYRNEPVEGISPEFLQAMTSVAFWILPQGIWQAVSQLTGITFGTAFQVGLLAMTGAFFTTHHKLSYVQINPQTVVFYFVILIGMTLIDNLPRLFMHSDNKLDQQEKPKRNVGFFDKSTKNQLAEADQPEQDEYLHKLDYLTGRGQR